MFDFASASNRDEYAEADELPRSAPRASASAPPVKREDSAAAQLTEALGDIGAWFEETEHRRRDAARGKSAAPSACRAAPVAGFCDERVFAYAASLGDIGALIEEGARRVPRSSGEAVRSAA